MSPPARLLALRLQGFKSFAERTVVEFGPGISAVVGPNGSGKSNLADALRWSLGEQGRALRSRKSEDVIFAGSEKRSALGMADVTLVLDNADGLLPVDFSVLELGRRLYRSGENDYLLNKQRIRLRDLVDLLDSAHLADNAFLFIGQGMVDQALALRPEERRPLFEEVAGVRRHERRRRKAEEQLAESETNLARVEDILVELRPQARRLAAQAEQQATRASAGDELIAALLSAGHARWHEAAAIAASTAARVERERALAEQAIADLQSAEDDAATIADELGERAVIERERLAAHESARAAVTELRLRETRLAGERESVERDRRRLVGDRQAAESSIAEQRRSVALPVPPRDLDLEAALAETDRLLAEANAEVGGLKASTRARGEEALAIRRAEAARQAEHETARRRLADIVRRVETERAASDATGARRAELQGRLAEATSTLTESGRRAEAAADARQDAQAATAAIDARRRGAEEEAGGLAAALRAEQARLEAIDRRLREDEERGIARAARRRGGRRLDEDLGVESRFRAAIDAVLDELARAYLVDASAVEALAGERGALVVRERAIAVRPAGDAVTRRFLDRLSAAGGTILGEVVRRDPTEAVRSVLSRAAVVPDIATALALQADLPMGWRIAVEDGSAVVTDLAVHLGRGDATLERRAEADRLRAEVARLEQTSATAAGTAAEARAAAEAAQHELTRAVAAEQAAVAERRRAEDVERTAARELDAASREAAWHGAQLTRLEAELARARETLMTHEGQGLWGDQAAGTETAPRDDEIAAIGAWEGRIADLRARRDRLAAQHGTAEAERREVEARRARAEATIAMDDERIRRAESELASLAEREERLETEIREVGSALAAAMDRETRLATELGAVRAAEAADRDRLGSAERAASAARDRLRTADDRLRAADRAALEARLGRDAVREQLIVELAGLGELGLARLEREAGVVPVAVGPGPAVEPGPAFEPMTAEAIAAEPDDLADTGEAAALETALDVVTARWATESPPADSPSPARLSMLRRRYHELGAANPFAVEEYDALRQRLDSLETQQQDLRSAIEKTRQLIAELNGMIAEQFRTTFAALEVAFDARFQQLFGGGFARLSLTDPSDLSATGIEIVARPPGKKAQALAMLSGGERALTAVALLFAMLQVRPVPFCVLDEVDAALDEANVGRFSDALRSLADRTQFIVITHNRGTIEAADALYGVTVGDDSVSRVISLRLDEAQAIADRQRGGQTVELAGVG
jgi:chromosome segregation protein